VDPIGSTETCNRVARSVDLKVSSRYSKRDVSSNHQRHGGKDTSRTASAHLPRRGKKVADMRCSLEKRGSLLNMKETWDLSTKRPGIVYKLSRGSLGLGKVSGSQGKYISLFFLRRTHESRPARNRAFYWTARRENRSTILTNSDWVILGMPLCKKDRRQKLDIRRQVTYRAR